MAAKAQKGTSNSESGLQYVYLNQQTEYKEAAKGGIQENHIKHAYRMGSSNYRLIGENDIFLDDMETSFSFDDFHPFNSLVEKQRPNTTHPGIIIKEISKS